jgi:hypothetical protein
MRLVKTFLVAVVVAVMSSSAYAQSLSLNVGSGRSPLVSGTNFTASYTPANDSKYLEASVMATQGWITYAPKFHLGKLTFTAGGTVGYQEDVAWVGPYVVADIVVVNGLETQCTYWPGVFPVEPETWRNDSRPNEENINIGHFGWCSATVGNLVTLSYGAMDFLNEKPNRMPGIGINSPNLTFKGVPGKVVLSSSYTLNTNAHNAGKTIGHLRDGSMFYIGVTWKPLAK